MKFGLDQEDINSINTIFQSFPEIDEVTIYGSRAKNNYRPNSDIDLTLKGNELNLAILSEIEQKIDDLLLPYLFDISIFNHISNVDLIDHINRRGLVFYKKE